MTLVSFDHNFIFVKTRKTAGTSIEIDLSKHLGPKDVVTAIHPPEPGHSPRNFKTIWGKRKYYNHMPASEIIEKLGKRKFERMFSFCVEREPVEKCISSFHMHKHSTDHNRKTLSKDMTWQEYCEIGDFPVDHDKYADFSGTTPRLLVNRIIRYDRLKTDLPALAAEMGIKNFKLGSKAKSGYSKQILIRPEDVTDEQRALIYKAFAPTLEVCGIDWNS